MGPDGSISSGLGLALPHTVKPVSNNLCVLPGHFQPAYLGASSSSKAALAYIQWLQQVVSDGNQSPDYATVRPSHALDEVVSSSGLSCSQMCVPRLGVAHVHGCLPTVRTQVPGQ